VKSKLYTLCWLALGMNALYTAFSQQAPPAKLSHITSSQAHAEKDDATLTNQKIIGLVRLNVGTGVIMNAIKSKPGRYSLDPKGLIQLTGAGVPAAVIEAMQAKENAGPATIRTLPSQPQVRATSAWVTSTTTDKFEGTRTVLADRIFAVGSDAFMRVDASCTNGVMEPFILTLYLQYLSARGSHIDFVQSKHETVQKIFRDRFSDSSTMTPQGGGNYVNMHVLVDGTKRLAPEADSSGTPITALFAFDGGLLDNHMISAHAIAANEIQIDTPLDNGDVATVKIEPREASFRQFASSCEAAFPGPRPIDPDAKTVKQYMDEGNKYLSHKDYDNAIRSYEAAVALAPDDPDPPQYLTAARNLKKWHLSGEMH
jgi:hypothetical protein